MTILSPQFASAERNYSVLTLDLLRLIAAGQGDSDEAEEARGLMDGWWTRMTAEQRQRMRWLTVDLDALDRDGPPSVAMDAKARAEWGAAARSAWQAEQAGRLDEAMAFLRAGRPADLPAAPVLFLQSRLWSDAGLPEVAVEFMARSERLDATCAPFTLIALQQAGLQDRATLKARAMLRSGARDPAPLLFASTAIMESVRHWESAEAVPVWRELRGHLSHAFDAASRIPAHEEEVPGIVAATGIALGQCLTSLGDAKAARQVIDRLIAQRPREADAYVMRGILRLDADRTGAIVDLATAVRLKTVSPWPHAFVAQELLRDDKVLEANGLANQAIHRFRDAPDKVKAMLHETLGISYSILGQPADFVLPNFDKALDLDPGNPRLQANRSVAQRRLTGGPADALRFHVATVDDAMTAQLVGTRLTFDSTGRAGDQLVRSRANLSLVA